MNFSLVKKHPVAMGAVVLVGGLILYAIYRSGSGSTADSVDTGATGYTVSPQVAAIQAGQAVQMQQAQTAVDVAQVQADVVNNQTAAALEVAKLNAERDIALAQVTGSTSEALATTQTNAEIAKAKIASDTAEYTVGTQATAYEAALSASTQQAQINANATIQIQDDRDAIVRQQLSLDASIIDKAGQDKSRSSTGWTQIISALQGMGPQAIAANQPSAVASSPGAILDGIANIGKALFGTA